MELTEIIKKTIELNQDVIDEEVEHLYQKILKIKPKYLEHNNNLGLSLHKTYLTQLLKYKIQKYSSRIK